MSITPARAASIRRNFEWRLRTARAAVDAAKHNLHEEESARDEFELSQRPEFPTAEMLIALEVAVLDVKEGHEPKTSQGRQLAGGVSVHGKWGYIWVDHGAPYGLAANGYLWKFTPKEIQAMRDHLKQFGARIKYDWPHEKGYTFEIAVDR